MKLTSVLSALVVTVGLSTPASAITITSISGIWQSADVQAGKIKGSDNAANGVGTSSISWGDVPKKGNYPLSAYSFDATETPFATAPDTAFDLGVFTHSNNPIWTKGEMLNGAELALSFSIEGTTDVFKSVFTFTHWETPNEHKNCADGGKRGKGVNANGCADNVSVSLNEALSESFVVGGMEYVLDITGFLHEGNLLDSFWTKEKAENSAILQASYKLISDNNPDDPQDDPNDNTPSEVPLPASGLLLLGGLAGLAMKRRKT